MALDLNAWSEIWCDGRSAPSFFQLLDDIGHEDERTKMREGVSGPDCERVDMYTAAQKQKILSELGNLPELPSRETRIRLAYTRRIYPEPLCDMRYVEAMGLAELAHEMHKNSREIVPPERLAWYYGHRGESDSEILCQLAEWTAKKAMDRRERPSAEYATKIKNHVEKRWYAILEASYRESRGKYERARRVYEDNGIDMDF